MNQAAWNQLLSGNRAPSKSVPAITDVSRSHSEQRRRLRRTRQAFPPPQLQRKPSGQRRRSRNARQSSSERNQLLNSSNVRGYSRPARGTTGTVVARAGRTLRRWPDVTNWQQPDTPVQGNPEPSPLAFRRASWHWADKRSDSSGRVSVSPVI